MCGVYVTEYRMGDYRGMILDPKTDKKVQKCKQKVEKDGIAFCGNSKISCKLKILQDSCPMLKEK